VTVTKSQVIYITYTGVKLSNLAPKQPQ